MRCPKTEKLSASGGEPPDPLTRALPLDPAGGSVPDLRYRLMLQRSPYLGAPLKFVKAPPWPQVLALALSVYLHSFSSCCLPKMWSSAKCQV